MPANNEKGSTHVPPSSIELILNFCRTVVRSDDEHLRIAMRQYAQSLATTQRR